MRCAIWYHLYNLKNGKKTHGGVLIFVKFQVEACEPDRGLTAPLVLKWILRCVGWTG